MTKGKAEITKIIGANIRAKRLDKKMSRKELAERMGISQSFLGYIEKGVRGVSTENLYKLSHIFEESIDSFFVETEGAAAHYVEKTMKSKRVSNILQNIASTVDEEELEKVVSAIRQLKKLRKIYT